MIDQYGQGNHFIFANATSPLALKDNKYQFNGMDEKVLRALQFLQDYNKKVCMISKTMSEKITA